MKRIVLLLVFVLCAISLRAAEPLRIFIRSGPKTHGPGQHDHPRFLEDWTKLLNERGAKATGRQGFPTAQELENTDVLVMYLAEGGTVSPEDRKNLDAYLKRGGGIVTIHDAVCGTDPHWFKNIVGGAWEHRHSKWYEGEIGVYVLDTEHPITRGISNFDMLDEIYYDLHLLPEAKILASSFHSVFVIAPQMWTYEKDNYRSFVCLQGHEYKTFNLPHMRAILLRGIAWAGKGENADILCTKEELESLKYPEGGPTAPEKAAAKLNVHPDFDISLVTSEPLVEKVISLDWDHKGRLWVAETPEYPGGRTMNRNDAPIASWSEHKPDAVPTGDNEGRKPKDRVSWLEDTNGDGRMDKKTIFADGLELVTSLVFHKDGVIVTQAPHILWLRDKDGDGKCNMQDERVVLYSGFGTFDTHAVINNMRWGADGWIYSAIGYSAGTPVSADSSKEFGRVTAGVIRFKPDGSALEQYASGSCNTWGLDLGIDNEVYYSTATCGEHLLHVVMPEKILARGNVGGVRASSVIPDHQKVFPSVKHTRPAYVQIDWVGAFTASSGTCIYNGGAWPEKYNGSQLLSEPTVSLVHHELINPKGVTYQAVKEPGRLETEFIAGTDLWFRPIHTRVGPDGALYVVDFYNQAAIHNDTRGPKHGARNAAVRPDRDHHFARVYRIQHKQARQLPKASFGSETDLVKALEHPNGWVRSTAQRLLVERMNEDVLPALEKLVRNDSAKPEARVAALWSAFLISGKHNPDLMTALYGAKDETLRKGAMQLLRNYPVPGDATASFGKLFDLMAKEMRNAEGRIRLETLMAVAVSDEAYGHRGLKSALWEVYPTINDNWTESALVAAFSREPEEAILAAASRPNAELYKRTVRELANRVASKDDAKAVAALLNRLAKAPAGANPLKQVVLDALGKSLKENVRPDWSAELASSFRSFLSSDEFVATAALPLIARWDTQGALTPELRPVVQPLMAKLGDSRLNDEDRAQVASGLIGLRRLNPEILPSVVKVLQGEASMNLKRRLVEALGNVNDEAIGKQLVQIYPALPFPLRDPVFGQVTRRPEWARELIAAVEQKNIQLAELGPALLHRLRTHPDKSVAERAVAVIESIRGPQLEQKDKIIAEFSHAVEQPGNLSNGKTLFTQNCANCHKFKGEGSDLAPDLTGMGAHGPHDLLVHILDPNRVVEPNFVSTSIETKDELSFDGIVTRENQNTVTLRNATGENQIRQSDIATRRSTGMSLMPDGFESLGTEGLRDLIQYLCADEGRYRILDLSSAFSADSTKGIYNTVESIGESLHFRRFGIATVDNIPFEIMAPTRTSSGKNVVVLKGGHGYAQTMPRKVEVPANVKASKLHFLGGVAGWGFPCCGDDKNENEPIAKVTVHFAGGGNHEIVLRNGVEFADYNGKYDVPGSKEAQNLVRNGQVRWFTKSLPREATIEKLTIESLHDGVAPTFVAITAESSQPAPQPTAAGQPAAAASTSGAGASAGKAIKVLIVGGGTHHDFARWFGQEDKKTLERDGLATVTYTEDVSTILPSLKEVDVLFLSNNHQMKDPAMRKGIFDFVESGKGLVLVHPALWYNWNDWPEYNARLAGGGSRSHPKYQEFEVHVTDTSHPITAGVPAHFKITDELYEFKPDPNGSPITVLAEGNLLGSDKKFPSVFTTRHDKGRIAGITLGHDEKAHALPAYQTLLRNAIKWAAGK